MREIKFRAWDEGNKALHKEVEFIRSGLEYNDWIIFKSNKQKLKDDAVLNNPYFQKQIKLMQYTGLKDKNGVDIYEGDILKYPYVRSSSVNYTIEIGVIEWSDEYCGFIIDEVQNIGGFCGIESKHMNELEVIGNIYENPELLKEG